MLAWLLPWEKLPSYILGPLLVLLGGFSFFHAQPYSSDQLYSGAIAIVGIGMSIYGFKRLIAEARARPEKLYLPEAEKRLANASAPPDYAQYTEAQLRQVLTRIDRERFPERVAEIEARLAAFKLERSGDKS